MSYRICCWTLFDITQTGVANRARPLIDEEVETWTHKRNTQCNFDTILQVISLRSQPEIMTYPKKIEITTTLFEKFGFLYSKTEESSYCWTFEFEIQHPSVFDNGIIKLGALYNDCTGVPMLICETQTEDTPSMLDSSDELKNIHFEEI